MTPPAHKRASKKTTPARSREDTVAEEKTDEQTDEAVADAPSKSVDDAVSLVPPPMASSAQAAVDPVGLGPCRVCGGPGVVKADFPWTADKPVFCRKDVPPQYRFLLSKS